MVRRVLDPAGSVQSPNTLATSRAMPITPCPGPKASSTELKPRPHRVEHAAFASLADSQSLTAPRNGAPGTWVPRGGRRHIPSDSVDLRKEQLGLHSKPGQGGDGVSVPVGSAARKRGGVSALSLQRQLEDAQARLAEQEEIFFSQPPEEAGAAQAQLDVLDAKLADKRVLHAGLTAGAEQAAPASGRTALVSPAAVPGRVGLLPASPEIRNEAGTVEALSAEIGQLTQQRSTVEAGLQAILTHHAQAKLASGPKIQQIRAEIGGIEAAMHWQDPAAHLLPPDADSARPRVAAAAGQTEEAPGEPFLQAAARRQEALLQAMGPHMRVLLQAIETRQQRQALEARLQQLNEAMALGTRQVAQADAVYLTARSAVADAELPLLSRTRWQRLADWASPARRHERTVQRFGVQLAEVAMNMAGDAVDQARRELGVLRRQVYAVHDKLQDLHQEEVIDAAPRVMDKRTAAELRGTLGGLLVSLKGLKRQAGSTANKPDMEEFQKMARSEAAQVQAKIDRIIKDTPQGKLLARWLEWQDRLQDLTEAGSMASKAGRKVAHRAALARAAQAQAEVDRITAELDLPPTPQEQLLAFRGELQDHLADLQAVAGRAASLDAGTEQLDERTQALVAQVQGQIDNITAELERRAGTEAHAGSVDRPRP